jgi:hypothetical protein
MAATPKVMRGHRNHHGPGAGIGQCRRYDVGFGGAAFERPIWRQPWLTTAPLSSRANGCLMEGISHEAISMAGHLGAARLTVLFDGTYSNFD